MVLHFRPSPDDESPATWKARHFISVIDQGQTHGGRVDESAVWGSSE
jgi:hypothetical protein